MRYWLLVAGMALAVVGLLGAFIEIIGTGLGFSELFSGGNAVTDAQLATPKVIFFSAAMIAGSVFITGSRIISHLRRIYEK